jgi:FtsP/CotA-like multicopper oxidase with cupredoxin domain
MGRILPCLIVATAASGALASTAWAADAQSKLSCNRPVAGSAVLPPPDLYSSAGVLNVTFEYVTSLDAQNRTLFCFVTPDGLQNPTLHVKPGDKLNIALTNGVPRSPPDAKMEPMVEAEEHCGARVMQPGTVNIHFHGMNVSPTCHSDEVVHTLVNPGQSFAYAIDIPKDEPAGMYWYHPHVHGFSDAAALGGGNGAIEVEGIENVQPKVAKLPSRLLILRSLNVVTDDARAVRGDHSDPAMAKVPSWDLSVNNVPISYPALIPATMAVQNQRSEFWRVVNATADINADLVLKYDGVAQPVQIVAYDGVATGSQDGTRHGKMLTVNDVFIPTAGRAEFVIPPIPATVKHVTLETLKIDTGPKGDIDTQRVLAAIQPVEAVSEPVRAMPAVSAVPPKQRFENLDAVAVGTIRHLYFSEIFPDPKDPNEGLFYITVAGQVPQLFDANAPPAIVTQQGAVEDWVIENRTQEVHEFHIHQIHFQVRAINKTPVPLAQRQFRDTFQVPYWTGTGPYPSVTLRMDFRGAVVGDFVYHCHILDHEDNGMMAIVRVTK